MLSNEPFYLKSQTGHDEAFLMLHGLGGGVYEMSPLARELHDLGHSVMAFNYPGHDQPARRMPASRWQEWYGKVEAAYEELAGQHRHVSVIGFSTGCLLGLRLAARHPMPVHRLILLSPFLRIRQDWYCPIPPENLVHRFGQKLGDIPRLRLPIIDREMERVARQSCYFQTFNLSAVISAIELIGEVREDLPRVLSPTLIIHSRKDRVVCPTGPDILMERLGSQRKQVHWLTRSDHIILLDVERDLVSRHIREFIGSSGNPPLSAESA